MKVEEDPRPEGDPLFLMQAVWDPDGYLPNPKTSHLPLDPASEYPHGLRPSKDVDDGPRESRAGEAEQLRLPQVAIVIVERHQPIPQYPHR